MVPALALVLQLGCKGQVGEPAAPGLGDETGAGAAGSAPWGAPIGTLPPFGGVPPGPPGSCATPHAPSAPLRHLTVAQYRNSVRDLLGIDSALIEGFPADETTEWFKVGGRVSPLLAEKYIGAAEDLAEQAVQNLPALLPCDPVATGETQCGRAFIAAFGSRAFRRPLRHDELQRFEGLFEVGRQQYDFQTGIQMVVQAALQSPHFLYRSEGPPLGAPGQIVPATDAAMASRLSYFLWNTMPDPPLLDAVALGQLHTPAQVEAQARRMLQDPRAHEGMRSFYVQWLGLEGVAALDKDPSLFPEFRPQLASALEASIQRYVDSVLWEGDGRVSTLLFGGFQFVNDELARVYGMPGQFGPQLARVPVDPSQRAGLLTQPALLALLAKPNQTDPVHRGKFVREQFLCQPLAPPPNDIVIQAPDPDPNLTTRERFRAHSAEPRCRACHQMMDPIGFGFENFDPLGRFRHTDQGMPVDASGEILLALDPALNGPFYGALDLTARLAGSQQVHDCVARQLLRYALTRIETDQDQCSVERVLADFALTGGSIRELMASITQTDAFLYRRIPEP